MKSMPEKDLWEDVKRRLENYSEETDDDWDNIAGALPASVINVLWFNVTAHAASLLALTTFLFLLTLSASETSTAELKRSPIANIDTLQSNSNGAQQFNSIEAFKKNRDKRDIKTTSRSKALPDTLDFLNRNVDNSIIAEDSLFLNNLASNDVPSDSNAAALNVVDSVLTQDQITLIVDMTNKRDSLVKQKEKKQIHPTVYFSVGPSLGYYKVTPLKDDEVAIAKLNSPDIFSRERLGINIEAGFQFKLSSKVDIHAGVNYFQQKGSISYSFLSSNGSMVEGSSLSYVIIPGIESKSFAYTMRNIGISTGFLYHLKGDKLKQQVGAAIQYHKGLYASNESYANAKSHYFNYQISYRATYYLNDVMQLYIQPAYIHSFIVKESLQEPFTITPYRATVGVGLLYSF